MVLELTVIRFAWFANVNYQFAFGQVIWVIGLSMMALAGLIYLPTSAVTAFGVAMIVIHNSFDTVLRGRLGPAGLGLENPAHGRVDGGAARLEVSAVLPADSVARRDGGGLRPRGRSCGSTRCADGRNCLASG